MPIIELYDAGNLSDLNELLTRERSLIRHYVAGLIREGAESYVANVKTKVIFLRVDDYLLPLTINESEYENSYVASAYAVIPYAEEEMERHGKPWLKWWLKPLFFLLKRWLKWAKINRMVIVNNALFSTNLYESLTAEQIGAITVFLRERFPAYTITFRSLNERINPFLTNELKKQRYRVITSRSVYFFDPEQFSRMPSKNRWIYKRDLALLEQEGIEVIPHEAFEPTDIPRIKELYDALYLEKYSLFNPQFTARFFEEALAHRTLTFTGIRYKERLVAVIAFFTCQDVMTTPIVGYDLTLPPALGLYRMVTALVIGHALKTGLLFHMSSGVGHFKRQRGAFQVIESTAVDIDHLSLFRRLPWLAFAALFNTLGRSILIRDKL
ncbi:MAG: GNAT family N-acetyltransferase [Simkaniaceae bacterium]|nr:GNAT family N-acetyltransferase [Simkaniaceae bacterium]